MIGSAARGRRLLVVGGTSGFVGRAVRREFAPDWQIRSLHRAEDSEEVRTGVEWVRGDAASVPDWGPLLAGVDLVVNLAWYRYGSDRRFRPLTEGLVRLVRAAEQHGSPRFVQVSVPDAPEALETGLPYLVRKREVDRAVASSTLPYAILRPTMLYGPGDKLLSVMMRTMARYHRFPMFGDGAYHVSPVAVADLARAIRREAERAPRAIVPMGGPVRWRYTELTAVLFRALGLRERYVRFSPRGAVRLARLLEMLGSSLLYAYEVEWLLSDRLGLPPYEGLGQDLADVRPFLATEAARLRGAAARPAR
jgi:uncharacterized protein YbjT (DUF2867 family)